MEEGNWKPSYTEFGPSTNPSVFRSKFYYIFFHGLSFSGIIPGKWDHFWWKLPPDFPHISFPPAKSVAMSPSSYFLKFIEIFKLLCPLLFSFSSWFIILRKKQQLQATKVRKLAWI